MVIIINNTMNLYIAVTLLGCLYRPAGDDLDIVLLVCWLMSQAHTTAWRHTRSISFIGVLHACMKQSEHCRTSPPEKNSCFSGTIVTLSALYPMNLDELLSWIRQHHWPHNCSSSLHKIYSTSLTRLRLQTSTNHRPAGKWQWHACHYAIPRVRHHSLFFSFFLLAGRIWTQLFRGIVLLQSDKRP